MPRRNPLQVALTILLVVIVIVVIAIFVTGCSSTDAKVTSVVSDERTGVENLLIVTGPESNEIELIGCVDDVCTFTFHHVRRCFLSIGSKGSLHADTWMFDLECPG